MYADELSIENLQLRMKEDDCFDVIVNNELEVHIRRNDVGYSVDLYRHATQEEMEDDDYDFDSDFISACTALDDDIHGDDTPITVYLALNDGTDRTVEDNSWFIRNENLYHNNELVIKDVLDDNSEIITAIVENYMSERVTSIDVDCEEIYNADEDE